MKVLIAFAIPVLAATSAAGLMVEFPAERVSWEEAVAVGTEPGSAGETASPIDLARAVAVAGMAAALRISVHEAGGTRRERMLQSASE